MGMKTIPLVAYNLNEIIKRYSMKMVRVISPDSKEYLLVDNDKDRIMLFVYIFEKHSRFITDNDDENIDDINIEYEYSIPEGNKYKVLADIRYVFLYDTDDNKIYKKIIDITQEWIEIDTSELQINLLYDYSYRNYISENEIRYILKCIDTYIHEKYSEDRLKALLNIANYLIRNTADD
jgi:hypothetical protein